MATPKNQFTNERLAQFVLDVSGGDSGAIGTVVLGALPAKATITQAWIDVQTTFTSATDAATIALGYTGATGAFDAAVAISDGSNPWDAAAPRASVGAADAAVGNFIALATNVDVVATIAAEALTAGKLTVCVRYYVAD